MNFRRTFLVKCLLLLFANVKYSVTSEIYMAVNESAFLSIAAAAGKVYDATWLKDKKKMLQLKNNSVKYYVNKEQCRCKILPNGTLQIDQVVKEDSGNYMVTVYQEDGKLKAEEAIMFIVQDPVPQPVLSAQCVNKTASVMCEVKQKTKDETFLMELTRDKSKSLQKNVTKLELHKQPSGTFRCVVKNKVSKKTAEKLIKCSEEDRKMHACQTDSEMVVRELPQPQCNPTPKQLRVQQRPLPQPHVLQQAQPPRPRPRTQQRTPHHSRERP
ncbi:T-cell surface antigen CD2 isoform X2 [Balearica regulorum gibbericeps]|uniref:T-cell surface antigen CD2 isoform X2 n=1 Tax=Balearica regulorum gibbericeps TaxID=100784 RepID=UPI003F616F60